jgi:membrane protease subunit HflC
MLKFALVVVIALFVVSQTAFVVPEWQQAVVLQFGKPIRTIKEPGLDFKIPFVQDIEILEKRILLADARPEEYITLDKKRLQVDSVSRWKIEDPLLFYRTVKNYVGAVARLNDIIFGQLREEVANHLFLDLIREERENIMAKVTKRTAEAATQFGINVVDVRIKRVDLPDEVQNSVFARMKAERERIAKRYRAEGDEKAREIRANADKDKEILLAEAYRKAQTLRGEGDAEATAIYAGSYGQDIEFYSFSRHLNVYEKVFQEDTTLLLRPDSELLRYLDSPSGTGKDSSNTGIRIGQ